MFLLRDTTVMKNDLCQVRGTVGCSGLCVRVTSFEHWLTPFCLFVILCVRVTSFQHSLTPFCLFIILCVRVTSFEHYFTFFCLVIVDKAVCLKEEKQEQNQTRNKHTKNASTFLEMILPESNEKGADSERVRQGNRKTSSRPGLTAPR